ncbi:Uncharacterised protein [Mycobacteroides abscessus subsp. abscessus]|nr:Uncharacterised protein [Mycobacteroides abscessus subsp. abscessus]
MSSSLRASSDRSESRLVSGRRAWSSADSTATLSSSDNDR